MKTHARVRRATSKTPGSVVKARVFFPTPRSAHFVIYVVDKGIWTTIVRKLDSWHTVSTRDVPKKMPEHNVVLIQPNSHRDTGTLLR